MTDTQSEQGKNKMYKVITGMFAAPELLHTVLVVIVTAALLAFGLKLIILTIAVLTTLAVFICLVGGAVLIVRKLKVVK